MPRNKILKDKNQITETAFRLIETEGLEAVSMRRLSKEMGVSHKTLYNYVENADSILREILIHSFSEIYERVYSMMKTLLDSGTDVTSAYAKAYAVVLYDFAEKKRDICTYLIGDGYVKFHNDAELRPFYNPFSIFLNGGQKNEKTQETQIILDLYYDTVLTMIRKHTTRIQVMSREEFIRRIDFLIQRMFSD